MIKSVILTAGMAMASLFGMNDGDSVVVERIESGVAVIESSDGAEFLHVEEVSMSQAVGEEISEGDVLTYKDGSFIIDVSQEKQRTESVEELLERLRNK